MYRSLSLFLLLCLSPAVVIADMNAANQALKSGDYVRAAEEFHKLAEQGDAKAQSHLGYMYYVGEGVPQSYEEAVKWYGKAAVQGDRDAQYKYAVAYAFGEGTKQDYKEAAIWYRRAAEQGHVIAQYSLGISYTYGEGVPQDEKLAAEWFLKAAEAGYENAEVMVGSLYHTGDGLPKNYAKAVEWYRKAADRGNAVAQYNLGTIYRAGKGVPKNTDEAMKWYRLAAAQNYEAAKTELASLERTLSGTRQEKTVSPPAITTREPVTAQTDPVTTPSTEKKVETPVATAQPTEQPVSETKSAVSDIETAPAVTEPEKSGGLLSNLKNLFKSEKTETSPQNVATPASSPPEKVAATPEPVPEPAPPPEPEPVPVLDEVQVEKSTPVIKTVEAPEIIAAIPETEAREEIAPAAEAKVPETAPVPETANAPARPVFTPGTSATSITDIARPRTEAPESYQVRTEPPATTTALINRPKPEVIPEAPVPIPAEPVTEVHVAKSAIAEVPEPEPAPAPVPESEPEPKPEFKSEPEPELVIADEPAPVTETEEKTGGLAAFFGRMFTSENDEPEATPVSETEIPENPPADSSEQVTTTSPPTESEPDVAISFADETTPAEQQLEVEEEQPGRLKSFFGRLFSSEEEEISAELAEEETVVPAVNETADQETASEKPETGNAPENIATAVPEPDSKPESTDSKTVASESEDNTLRGMEELQIAKLEIPAPATPVETKAEQALEQIPPDSIEALTARAVTGDPDAQFELGKNYHHGIKVKRDLSQAFVWYRRAALQGNEEAQFTVGNMYLMGEGTNQSDLEAKNWFEKAARQGHEKARHNLENLKPVVAEQPASQPVEQLANTDEEDSDKGGVFGLVSGLFDSDEDDEAITSVPDQATAPPPARTETAKAETGKVPGQSDYERGLAYSYGDGVPQNYQNAFKLFESAARLGHASAQYQLALAYVNGHGVTRNPEAAIEWYEKAARQGLTIAQRSLGNAYLNGEGVPANKALAHAWYSILADQGNVLDVHRRDSIKTQLTDTEIRESERLKQQLSASLSTASTSF